MADPQPTPTAAPIVLPTGWRSNRAVVEVFSLHTLLWVLGAIAYYLSTLPSLASAQSLFQLVAGLLGFSGAKAMVSFKTPTERAMIAQVQQAGMGALQAAAPAASSVPSTPALVLFLLSAFMALPGCATVPIGPIPTPDPAKYKAAFTSCLESNGISDATPEGMKIWTILDQGAGTPAQIVANIERAAATLGADTAILVLDCAVIAWDYSNPVPPNVAPTKGQAATRLYRAKHLNHPTLHRHARAPLLQGSYEVSVATGLVRVDTPDGLVTLGHLELNDMGSIR
jgi:hypothetical protein